LRQRCGIEKCGEKKNAGQVVVAFEHKTFRVDQAVKKAGC
jgi:hypothetical protein